MVLIFRFRVGFGCFARVYVLDDDVLTKEDDIIIVERNPDIDNCIHKMNNICSMRNRS